MQFVFWKKGLPIIIFFSLMSLFPLGIIVAGIIMTISGSELWVLLPIGIFFGVICIIAIIVEKDMFTKVILSNEGIAVKQQKNSVVQISWCDVEDVKTMRTSRAVCYLSFIEKDKQINVAVSQRLYNTVMGLCSNRYIKTQIEDIPRLDYYKKRRLHQLQNKK